MECNQSTTHTSTSMTSGAVEITFVGRCVLTVIPTNSFWAQVEALLLALIQEGHSTVLDAVEKELLPALAAWVASSDLLLDAVVPSVLEAGLKVLQQ